MSLAALVSLFVTIAKAIPAFDSILLQANAALLEHRRTQAHAQIDQAIADAQRTPWECPAACPYARVQRVCDAHAPAQPNRPAAPAS